MYTPFKCSYQGQHCKGRGVLLTKEEKKIVPGVMNSVLAPYTRVLPIMIDDYCTKRNPCSVVV